ncbi:MAG: discoidin domain-containing protein [bacterium]|nr:discoidin domain-containing protein [bacterium]
MLSGPAVLGGVVTPDSVVTTSYYSSNTANENMIDGSGLSGAGPVETQVHDAHAGGSGFTMWHAGPNDGGLGGPTGTPPPVAGQAVVFDLGGPVWLDGVYIWNFNQAGWTGRGVNDFEILVSGDSDPLTATFTSVGSFSLAQACGCATEGAQLVSFAAAVSARLVKFDIATTHSGQVNNYVGLSEVRFLPSDNVDPTDAGAQYAWGENVGWLNAEPQGDGGPGVHVDDFELTGWMWGENVGWISLSCKNDSTCAATDYGVLNDGGGVLSGYAWGENTGWVNFAPASGGVVIDVATGEFSGHAWGENIGWISFASSGTHPFQMRTGWNCDPAPPAPAGSPVLSVARSGTAAELSWGSIAGATGYDIVEGDLTTLRSSGGDFSQATDVCLSNHRTTRSLSHADTPTSGEGIWYLVRGENCAGKGSHDSDGAGQDGLRDAEITASGDDCP